MISHTQMVREQAVTVFGRDPGIVHRLCGVPFELTFEEARLLFDILQEQERYCLDSLRSQGIREPQFSDPSIQYMYRKVIPQIQVAGHTLRAMSFRLGLKILVDHGPTIRFEPTHLEVTFLLQALEWMEICLQEGIVVDIARFSLIKKFASIQESFNHEFDFWLCAEYIDHKFNLERPRALRES